MPFASEDDERRLARKLVETSHLSVPERRSLGGPVKLSRIIDAIEAVVRESGRFPAEARLDWHREGAILLPEKDGAFAVYWRYEVAFQQYMTLRVETFATLERAAHSVAKGMGAEIDGVPIDELH